MPEGRRAPKSPGPSLSCVTAQVSMAEPKAAPAASISGAERTQVGQSSLTKTRSDGRPVGNARSDEVESARVKGGAGLGTGMGGEYTPPKPLTPGCQTRAVEAHEARVVAPHVQQRRQCSVDGRKKATNLWRRFTPLPRSAGPPAYDDYRGQQNYLRCVKAGYSIPAP